MTPRISFLTIALFLSLSGLAASQTTGHSHSPYAGQETRGIKSLSEEDLAELRRGGGWGLAKAAELNGVPGPAHLLELRTEIALTPDQVAAIEAIYAKMKIDAIAEGEKMISLEQELEDQFRARSVSDQSLRSLIAEIEASRGRLRYIHLSTHLTTPPLLSQEQIEKYHSLRGYGGSPCDAVPAGHDPAMWRKHNGCE
jgi:hypothetical protein